MAVFKHADGETPNQMSPEVRQRIAELNAAQSKETAERFVYSDVVGYLQQLAAVVAHDARMKHASPEVLSEVIRQRMQQALESMSPGMLAHLIQSERNGTGPGPRWGGNR